MDERFTSLRSDPAHNTQVYPHSGNGVAQLKNEGRVTFSIATTLHVKRPF